MATTKVATVSEPVTNAPVEIVPVTEPTEKSEKTPKVPKAPAAHPTFFQMIKEAIVSLKERTGSSQHAIAKYLEDKYKSGLPPNFRKTLSVQLKHLAKSGKLIKVKNSFKLSEELKKVPKAHVPKAPKRAKKEMKKTVGRPKTVSKTKAADGVVSLEVVKKATKTTKGTKVKPAKATKKLKPVKAPSKEKVSTREKSAKRKAPAPRKTAVPALKKARQ